MPRTKTDDALAHAEAAHANDPARADLIARARRFKASWFELAEALTDERRRERYRGWGYANFDDYCKRELHLRPGTVEKLTGSFGFLRTHAPEVLERDGRGAPIPTYQAVDFWRRAEEADAPEETVREIRRHVLDEGTTLPKLSRIYREVVFPVDDEATQDKRRQALVTSIARVVELMAVARDEGWAPPELCAEAEEPLARLAGAISPAPSHASQRR
jgi:hypothetical protein